MEVDRLFFLCQKIDQQCRNSAMIQHAGYTAVAGTPAAAAAAVGKDDQACRAKGKRDLGREFRFTRGYGDFRVFNLAHVAHSGASPDCLAVLVEKRIPVRRLSIA